MTPIGIQLNLSGDRQVEQGLLRVRGAMDNVGSAASGMGRALGGIAGAFAGVLSVREFVQAADAVTSLQNQLKLATGSATQAAQAYGALFDIAQRSRVSFTELGGTFASIARATGELGISQQRLLAVTEAIGNAVTISGTGAQAANAALVQLGQGLASGTLRGEELNSVMEQTPRLAKALADGLGITIGELRKLGSEGAITAEKVIQALESQAGALQGEVKDATLTVGQAFTQLKNSAVVAVGDFDKASGASQAFAGALSGLAGSIDTVGGALKENQGVILATLGALGGAGAAAGVLRVASAISGAGGMVAAIGAVRAAFLGLTAVMAANPVGLALLGIGAATGAAIAMNSNRTGTLDGVAREIEVTSQRIARAEAQLQRAGGSRGEMTRRLEERLASMHQYRTQLQGRQSEMLAGPSGVGGGRGTVNPESVGVMAARNAAKEAELISIRQKLYGVDKDYLPTLEKLHKQYQDGSITLAEYQGLVGKLADANHKKDKGGADGLKAEQSAYESLMTTINEKIGTVQAELSQNDKLTASQKIAIDMEAGLLSGKLKLSSARKAELEGRLEDLRTLEEEIAARQRLVQSFDAMEAAQAKALADRDTLRGQVYDAEQEAKQIGVVGAALGELTKARMEDAAAALERQAVTRQAMGDDTTAQALREQAQAMRDLYRVQGNNEAARGVAAYAGAIRESSEAIDYELSLMGMAERARAIALEQYRIEIELRKQIQQIEASTAADPERRRQLIADATAAAAIAKASASSKVFLEEWKQSVQQYDDIFRQGFADMLNNGRDGWKSFTRSLVTTFKTTVADQIYKMFAQPFVVQLVGSIMGIAGGGVGNAAMQMATGGGAGGMADLLSMGKNIYSAISGGFAGISTDVAYAVQRGLNFINPGSALGAPGGFAGSVGAVAGYGAGIAGGIYGGRFVSGGYSAFGGSGNSAVNVGTAIGAVLGGPLGAFLGGLAGGAVNRLFGRKLKDSGIEGEFGGDTGFEGRQFEYYKGGLFRSNKTKYKDLDEEVRAGLGDQFIAMRDGTANMAEILGLGTESIESFSAKIKVSLKGLSAEEAQKKLQEEFDKIAETLAGTALGTEEYTRKGETAVETLVRLSGSLTAVNGVFDTLGLAIYDASLSAADAASSFIDLFGGIENLNAAAGAYYQNFYSETERRDKQRAELDKVFDDLGIERINYDDADARAQFRTRLEQERARMLEEQKAREALRSNLTASLQGLDSAAIGDAIGGFLMDTTGKLEEGVVANLGGLLEDFGTGALSLEGLTASVMELIGPTDEAGKSAEETVAALLRASGAFAAVTQSSDDAAEAARRQAEEQRRAEQDARSQAFRNYENALDREFRSLDGQREFWDGWRGQVQESIATLDGLFDVLHSNVRELYGEVQSTASMQAEQGRAYVKNALTVAQRTGVLPESEELAQAIQAARGGLDVNNYATQNEADFARLVLAGQLSALEDITGKQKSIEEKQLETIEAQLSAIDRQTRLLQEQRDELRRLIDIENGTYNATISYADAYFALLGTLAPGGGGKPGGSGDGKKPTGGSSFGGGASTPAAQEPARYYQMVYGGTAGVGYSAIRDESLIARLDKLSPVYHAFDGTGDLVGLAEAFKAAGGTIADLEILSGNWASDWRKAFAGVGIPAFAVGTNYVPRDMLAQIHEGEAIVPKAFNPWAGGGGMQMNTARLERLVESLAQRLDAATAELEAIRNSTGQLADQFDRTSAGGNAMAVEVMNKPTVAVEPA